MGCESPREGGDDTMAGANGEPDNSEQFHISALRATFAAPKMTTETNGPDTGTATVVGDAVSTVAMVTDGRCFTDTLERLASGADGKPLPPSALEKARVQAIDFLDDVLRAYDSDVAAGEVGAGGTAKASQALPLAGRCPTGLLYGRIQSGKTLGMITFTALAFDNGFRVVVVLTSDNVKLVEQTADRFAALEGPLIRSSTQMDRWKADAEHVRKEIAGNGLVLISAKNQSHLEKLVAFLKGVGAESYPALVLDDEADQATLDTTVNARASGRANAPKQGSTISRRTVLNDASNEIGESVRETLRHNLFLQVTATPYALLLQNSDSPSRPKFTKLLEPGDGYTGGEAFFSMEHIEETKPPIVLVPEEESRELERGTNVPPRGLVEALSFFLVSLAIQVIRDPKVRGKSQNFLCHTSQRTTEHEKLSNLIREFLSKVGDALRKPNVEGEIAIHLSKAHQEMGRTLPDRPTLDEICGVLRTRLPKREVIVVNSTGSNAEFSRGINFIVGGNILGRGLTIDNLLVTYYLRSAKVSQMDTMLQHARMFGYREALMPLTRVFLPERLAIRFHRIHTAETNLRNLLSNPDRRARIPVQVFEGMRVTRYAVLDMGCVLAYMPGVHIYPGAPRAGATARREYERVGEAILRLMGGTFVDHYDDNLRDVTIDEVLALLPLFPFEQPDEANWDPTAIHEMLLSLRTRFANRAFVYSRRMKRTRFTQGALSGDDLKRLQVSGRPVLCIFKDDGHKYQPYPEDFWYPSFVLPAGDGMPAHVFNRTE